MIAKVLVTRQADGCYTARALAVPDVVASGATEADAVDGLRHALDDLRARSHVVDVDLPLPIGAADNPWLRMVGIWANDADWDEFRAAIEAYRREVDAGFAPD